jgi:hypothetical protein
MATPVHEAALSKLRQTMRGDLITEGHASYDEARKVWNGDIDRRPAVIARCTSVDDVRAALAFARTNELRVAVRSGGHSWPGHCIADDAMVIDLRRMNDVHVDASKRLARVQAGAVWAEVDAATFPHGLAMTGGHVTHTGVAGLTLGGGVGHLMRKFGLTIDALESAQLVTADGRLVTASASENDDLFWAIRGGGGNFGIVTEFTFRLAPLGPEILGGLAFWAPADGPALLRRWRDFTHACPDEVTTVLAYLHAPPLDAVPEPVRLKPGYALVVAGTDIPLAERTVKDLRAFGPSQFDLIGPMPYAVQQSLIDPAMPHGTRSYIKAHYLYETSDATLDAIHAQALRMPPGRSQIINIQMGGAVARVPEDATAFGGRKAACNAMFVGIWDEDHERSRVVDWVRGAYEALQPWSQGAYVNLSDAQDESTLKMTYGAAKYARLQRIKAKYDPTNVFCLNQNITPATV